MFVRLFIVMLVAGLAASAALTGARAGNIDLPVPRATIHPGDLITEDMVIIRRFPDQTTRRFQVVVSRSELVGKIARRTLQPGHPVPATAIAPDIVIKRGEPARLVFQEGSLFIIAQAEALQNGTVGSFVRVRNIDSGLIVTGKVQPDGSVLIGN
ncbi:flagellar basal body P-ring formation protein FlgA [Microvirga tunisiensis]|uniref:Flagella basal body P-ring formation protein FlgA n=2 Tax=Pannonibacter tanglangensis TaxID=2750084 RepID=A0A7X5JAF6_9HYPH|nr:MULTISPECIES: flagellar basal body P-ring formation chaperone FlgA [unclassified Pannonibacter]NBN64878.1 flagellar basal body P-ring formation protein FlgA [Pannonibacter sp. XCT-34]NBN79381.1 flagellar basal body P-ring formation protein FlgA [Pannonibacter sp. XCT-53]